MVIVKDTKEAFASISFIFPSKALNLKKIINKKIDKKLAFDVKEGTNSNQHHRLRALMLDLC